MKAIVQAATVNVTVTSFRIESCYHAIRCGRPAPPSAEEKRKCVHGPLGPIQGYLFTGVREYPATQEWLPLSGGPPRQ